MLPKAEALDGIFAGGQDASYRKLSLDASACRFDS